MTPDLGWWGTLIGLLAVQAAALTLLGAAAELRVRAPQARRVVWQAVLLGVALVWVAEISGLPAKAKFPHWRKDSPPAPKTRLFSIPSSTEPPALAQTGDDVGPAIASEASSEDEFPAEPTVSDPSMAALPATPVKWPGWIWLCGAAVLLLRSMVARTCLALHRRRMTQAGTDTPELVLRLCRPLGLRRVCLQTWPGLRGPIAFGFWRPTIALPADFASRFTPAQREAMLAHELAHLAGRDPFWLALADAILALAWWHPGVWWARKRFRVAGESAADEASALVPSGPSALAESLVLFGRELATPDPRRGLGVAGSGHRSDLSRRVMALLDHSGTWRRLPAGWRWSPRLAALGIAAMMAAAPVRAGFSGSVFGAMNLRQPSAPNQADSTLSVPAKAAASAPTPAASEPANGSPDTVVWQTWSEEAVAKARQAGHPVLVDFTADTCLTCQLNKRSSLDIATTRDKLKQIDAVNFIGDYTDEDPAIGAVLKKYNRPSVPLVLIYPKDTSKPPVVLPTLLTPGIVAQALDDLSGLLTVQATKADVIAIQNAIERLNVSEPGSHPVASQAQAPAARISPPAVTLQLGLGVNPIGDSQNVKQHVSEIKKRLQRIRLKEVAFENVPLTNVLKKLTEESIKNDPEKIGIQLVVQPAGYSPSSSTNHAAVSPRAPTDIGGVLIKIDHPLHNITLEDLLDAICVIPEVPLTYVIQDRTVVFFARTDPNVPLINRAFRVNLDTFTNALLRFSGTNQRSIARAFEKGVGEGVQLDSGIPNARIQSILNELARDYFTSAGINLDPPRSVYFNDRASVIMVHATEPDVIAVENAIEFFRVWEPGPQRGDGQPLATETRVSPPAVTLLVRFTELPEQSPGELGLDWLFGLSPTNNPALRAGSAADLLQATNLVHTENYHVDALRTEGESATLNEAQFHVLFHTLEERDGVDILSAPTVKTLSGRKARIEIRDVKTIVSAATTTNGSPANKNQALINYLTEQVGVGPMFEVTPAAEGRAWRLTALASLTEFLGYDKPKKGDDYAVSTGGKPVHGVKPYPHFQVLEARASALLSPGQTLALRGPSYSETNKVKGGLFHRAKTEVNRKRLYIFVTVEQETAAASATRENSPLIIEIAKTPPFFSVGSKPMTIEEVRSMLADEIARDPEVKVQMQPDRDAPISEILKVLQVAKEARIKVTPSLLVAPEAN